MPDILIHLLILFTLYTCGTLKAGFMRSYHGLLSFHIKRLWMPCFLALKRFKRTIIIIAAISGTILTVIALIRLAIGNDTDDIVHSITSLLIPLSGMLVLFWLGMVGLSAFEIHKYLFDRFSSIWINDHRIANEAEYFEVPYWRFWLYALVPAFIVFFIFVEPVFLLWINICLQGF